MTGIVLDVQGLTVEFQTRTPVGALHKFRAVDGVSFTVASGETLAIVGESGSGKTTVARTLVRLERAVAGTALMGGTDLLTLKGRELRQMRRQIQMVFQDPHSAMNPRLSVGEIVAEPFRLHPELGTVDVPRRIESLLDDVGLRPSYADRRPHELSGGQLQRVGLARALALEPRLIICDESVSALDVSIQAQVLNLLVDLQEQTGVSYLFISHDLAVVRHVAHRVVVMRRGELVEQATTAAIFERPQHQYTRDLIAAIPRVGERRGGAFADPDGELP